MNFVIDEKKDYASIMSEHGFNVKEKIEKERDFYTVMDIIYSELYDKNKDFRQMYNWLFCRPKGRLNNIQSHNLGLLFLRYFAALTIVFCISFTVLNSVKDYSPEKNSQSDPSFMIAYMIMGNIHEDNVVVKNYHMM